MMENIYDVIAWGRVVVQGKEYLLLSPIPYGSDIVENGVGRSFWQAEGTLKWEVADSDRTRRQITEEFDEDGEQIWVEVYFRSIIIFGSDALIEFYQDPKTIKVKYVTPSDDDQN